MCHTGECAQQVVRFDIVPKDASRDPSGYQRLDGKVEAMGLSLPFGRLGELYGRRSIFLTGLSLLATPSVLGGVTTGPVLLLAARALQGVASAMTAGLVFGIQGLASVVVGVIGGRIIARRDARIVLGGVADPGRFHRAVDPACH